MIGSCRSGADFSRISAEGRSRSTRHLWIRSVSDPEVRPPRVAFAIGRRNGPAVRRNRARRRIRAALREVAADVAPGLHLIGWKGPIGEVDFIELKNELVDLMSRTEEHR
ncbi:MAG TPA: ribonuclease P protein component [Acidimicrobiales bacterium]|nr:ribonuclease P protein component [Acidimicrobiales bacterium]